MSEPTPDSERTAALPAVDPPAPGRPDQRRPAPPPGVVVAAVSWVLLAGLLLWAWATPTGPATVDGESIEIIRGTLGADAVAQEGSGSGVGVLLVVLALVVAALAAALLLGRGWAMWPLTIGGVLAVILLATGGRWETLVAMLLVVVATLALMPRRSRLYLAP
jgi:hypothetical protein